LLCETKCSPPPRSKVIVKMKCVEPSRKNERDDRREQHQGEQQEHAA
jgi:hypothetical protein